MTKKNRRFPRHRKKKPDVVIPPTVSWTHYFRNAAYQLFTSVKSTLYSFFEDQQTLELTITYKTYSSAVIATAAVQCFSPLILRPYPTALVECGRNMVTWGGITIVAYITPNHRVRLSLQLLINALRFLEDDATATFNLAALLLVHIPAVKQRFSNEKRALLYISIAHLPTTVNAYHYIQKMRILQLENNPIIKKYEALLNITLTDPYQDAEKYFFIYKNVPHLAQARNKFFLELHNNRTHHELRNLFIAAMSQADDIISLENRASMTFFECGLLSLSHNRTLESPSFAQDGFYYEFAKSLTCIGWDNLEVGRQQGKRFSDFASFQTAQNILWREANTYDIFSPSTPVH